MNSDCNYTRAIKDLAEEDRPRENAASKGFRALTTAELLAILIGSGSRGESVVDLCQRILNANGNKLYNLSRRNIQDLTSAQVVYDYIKYDLWDLDHEEFWIITLNRAKRITGKFQISHGGTSSTDVDIKILLKTALQQLAACIIAIHNHPSGNLMPSHADNMLTENIR